MFDFTKSHLLRDEGEYAAAVAEIERLLDADPPPTSEEYERLEFLSVLVQAYEEARFPMPEQPTPQEVVYFMLGQKGLTRADLARGLGGERQMVEFFSGRRRLSLRQIEALGEQMGIPADLLIGPPHDASDIGGVWWRSKVSGGGPGTPPLTEGLK